MTYTTYPWSGRKTVLDSRNDEDQTTAVTTASRLRGAHRPRPVGAIVLPVGLALSLMVACGTENLIPEPPAEPTTLYWELTLNHRAVALADTAPYDTLQLVATPRNYRGDALPGLSVPEFTSSDPDKVAVTSSGLLVAISRTPQPVWVYATLTTKNIKHMDSALVSVVDTTTPPVLVDLSIHPLPPDSAKVSALTLTMLIQPTDTLPIRAVDATGGLIPIAGRDAENILPVDIRSADTNIVMMGRRISSAGILGEVLGVRPGTVALYASTTAFGITKADTLQYRVGLPVLGSIGIPRDEDGKRQIMAPDVTIGLGGFVDWSAQFDAAAIDTVDITFADANVSSIGSVRPVLDQLAKLSMYGPLYYCMFDCDNGGNVLLTKSQWLIGRHFPVPGTYEYHSVKTGLSGRIVVVDEREP